MEKASIHTNWITELKNAKSLESWLANQSDSEFPSYDATKGELSYPKRYEEVKRVLLSVHEKTTIGALMTAYQNLLTELNSELKSLDPNATDYDARKNEIERKLNPDNFTYLTHHGSSHVHSVINRLYTMLIQTNTGTLSAFEVFVLLCAAQVHDVGNIFGRDEHVRRISDAADEALKPIITDKVLRNIIYKIASVHGGMIDGNKDTIFSLPLDNKHLEQWIRHKLLASLLRFADETSDDSSRADALMMDYGKLDPTTQSAIHHAYSASLGSVSVDKSDDGHTAYIRLEHTLFEPDLTINYAGGKDGIALIDEIFERARKMERERLYCGKYFGTILPLTGIRLFINIYSEEDSTKSEILSYTLSDSGYPTHNIKIVGEFSTNIEIINHLNAKGWRLK